MAKRLVDPNHLCMGCMQELNNVLEPCPRCGFNLQTYQRPKNSLPLYEILNGKYLAGKVIGMGGFGITYIGWDFYQGKKVCIKEYFPRQVAFRNQYANSYQEQISVMISTYYHSDAQITHDPDSRTLAYVKGLESYIKEAENLAKFFFTPGIVSVRDYFYGNNTAYIVMEYIDGINLKHYARRSGGVIHPEELFQLLKVVLQSLDKVHKAGIIHRDISPDNIMIDRQRQVKMIDFGAAKDFCNSETTPVFLKHGYAPLEQYDKNGKQGPWTDVYSMCATIYALLTGVRIPNAKIRQQNDNVQLLQAMGVPISEEQDLAIRKGLSINPEDRYQSIAELYQDLYGEPIDAGVGL